MLKKTTQRGPLNLIIKECNKKTRPLRAKIEQAKNQRAALKTALGDLKEQQENFTELLEPKNVGKRRSDYTEKLNEVIETYEEFLSSLKDDPGLEQFDPELFQVDDASENLINKPPALN